MRQKSVLITVSLLLLINGIIAADVYCYRVLFISSYHPSFPTFHQQVDGLQDVFKNENVLLDIEFMDSKRFPGDDNLRFFDEYLSRKLAEYGAYDLIITADDNAFNYCVENRSRLFGQTPHVFFGVNDIEKALAQNDNPYTTGFIEAVSMEGTIALIPEIFPDVDTLYVISDGTTSGRGDYESLSRIVESFPELDFRNLNLENMSWKELSDELSSLGSNSAVLLLSAYIDKDGEVLLFSEGLSLITSSLDRPLFHLWYHGLGQGVLGGALTCMPEQSRAAAEMGLRLLKGENTAGMVISEKKSDHFIFDYNQLRKFNIPRFKLPKGSRIANKPERFYSENEGLFLVIIAVIVILSILLVVLTLNIMSRRRIEIALRESEEQYKSLFYRNKSVMLLVDQESGQIVNANDAAVEYYNTSREDLMKESLYFSEKFVDDNRDEVIREYSRGIPTILNLKFRRNSTGEYYYIEVLSSPVVYQGRKCLYSIIHDVTEKTLMQKEVLNAKMNAEHALKIKNDFLANISHELRTPLNGIVGMHRLLANAKFTEDEKIWYNMAVKASDNLSVIIDDLLHLTQSESGKLSIEKKFFEISQVPELILDVHTQTAEAKGLKLTFKKDYQNRYFFSDINRIIQLLNNLVINSIKYSDEGTVCLEVKENGDSLELKVSDEGIGIAADKIEEIFEPFRQLEDPMTKTHRGMGLGLAIVRNIADILPAELKVESEPNRGTVFTVLIPGRFCDSLA
ncbi:MAG: ATP-binding protein [Spirochaetales bacterium]|uniref:histidine kinase n=1 Tax=Candidatus Thalassospirochaeta sargassi TaxID=3119039 RepID=A0AAJ1IAG1_9SPIO|nr:ATP-binding protein [Spirochaetales bacterium]